MAQIFPKSANLLPAISLAGLMFGGIFLIGFIWYYFSPEFTHVGYAPEQPVPFSHRQHVAQLGLDCQYCHSMVEVSKHAMVPPTQTCMTCHSQIRPQALTLLPVRESWATGNPIEWVRVHDVPDYAVFPHDIHVNVGVGCETCHGRIDQMDVVFLAEPLSMSWCLDCHRAPEQYLRPREHVTTMGYQPPTDYIQRNLERVRTEGIRPPDNCSACHY